jgi:hypothetical protein
MKSKHFSVLSLAFITAWFLCLSASAPAADSTSFNPTAVQVKVETHSVPIGTIVAWPVEKNPADWHKWLECDGQTIDPAVYPELAALAGARVPDLRGQFLRCRPAGLRRELPAGDQVSAAAASMPMAVMERIALALERPVDRPAGHLATLRELPAGWSLKGDELKAWPAQAGAG